MLEVERDRIKNKTVRKRFDNIPHIVDLITLSQAQWIGKMAMMDDDSTNKCQGKYLPLGSIILGKLGGCNYAAAKHSQEPLTQQ
jgi:hypothetical protein